MKNVTESGKSGSGLEKMTSTLARMRFLIIGLCIVILLGIAGIFAFNYFSSSTEEKAATIFYEMEEDYSKWLENYEVEKEEKENPSDDKSKTDDDAEDKESVSKDGSDEAAEGEKDDADKTVSKDDFLKKAKLLEEEYKGTYAHRQSLFLMGQYYIVLEEWEKAAVSFQKIYNEFPKVYLAPVALLNAAAALENAKQLEKAISLLLKMESYEDSPLLPLGLFNLGRLYEQSSQVDKAKIYYSKLEEKFPESSWTNLARSRRIYLELSGKKATVEKES